MFDQCSGGVAPFKNTASLPQSPSATNDEPRIEVQAHLQCGRRNLWAQKAFERP